jgi:hypothetical protein
VLNLDIDPDRSAKVGYPGIAARLIPLTSPANEYLFLPTVPTPSQRRGWRVTKWVSRWLVLGTYSRERARDVRALAAEYGLEALITDDYLAVERAVTELQPELVLGTQMERHIAKRSVFPVP